MLTVLTFEDEIVATCTTRCVPGNLDPAYSRLGGSWRGGTVGQELSFTLTMTDGYNNTVSPQNNPRIDFQFASSGPQVIQDTCGACKGVYPFRMKCESEGVFNMSITVNEQGSQRTKRKCFPI